ncbi:MAG: DJ-1/PfpI family protein [Proteobacteria bacterium]|nr:DJ-1/PfpI family protein [Pseudomonadota bacterium]
MKRRDLLQTSAAIGLGVSLLRPGFAGAEGEGPAATAGEASAAAAPLRVPTDGVIPVAFLISAGAVVIDFAGPWAVFESVDARGPVRHPFRPYTVAQTLSPVRVEGGMTIVPNYTLAAAPAPKVVVIPAQSEPTKAVLAWVRKVAQAADVVMSVCTGAFLLAQTGLLAGKRVATHHSAYSEFAMAFPDIKLQRGARFVDLGNIASSGGLSSGMDLALHVVERYFGREVAAKSVELLEYQGRGWMDPNSNSVYAQRRVSTAEHPVCPVCEMDVDPKTSPRSTYQGKTYFFCMDSHKTLFESKPGAFVSG